MLSNVIILFLYVSQHISSLLLLKQKGRPLLLYIGIGLLAYSIIYALKQPSYDILTYLEAFSYADVFEPGYYLFTLFLTNIGLSNEAALTIIRLTLALLFLYIPFRYLEGSRSDVEKIALLIVIISSVAFSLGVNNAIRQGFSSILLMLSLLYFWNHRVWPSIFWLIGAVAFHKSAPFFWLYAVMIFCLIKLIYRGRLGIFRLIKFSIGFNRVVLFLIPIGAVVLLLILLQHYVFGAYLEMNISAGDVTRTSAILKTSVVFLVFVISEVLFGKHSEQLTRLCYLRFLRTGFLALTFWLSLGSMFGELAARILYFYFVIELFVTLVAYQEGKKLGAVVILLSYAFALNAINIFTAGGFFR